jgi:DNA-binding NtrC family response regulator
LTLRANPRVLIYGRHSTLLETRAQILQRAGYKTSAVLELAAAEKVLAQEPVDLSILCHTLTPSLREQALARARALQPAIRVLILSAHRSGTPLLETETVFHICDGPRALIAKVDTVLGRPISPLTLE